MSDLSAKLESYQHDFWSGLTEGSLKKVGGHIGEAIAADQLTIADISVSWPDTSNQPGWDLLIDGHAVNVKLVSDASSLSEHFTKYPDIPVLIPGDADNIPEGAIHFDPIMGIGIDELKEALAAGKETVLVNESLSHEEIMEQVNDATDFALGSPEIADGSFPFVTLAFSGWREITLLTEEKTGIARAFKNLGLDIAGTGLGGYAGLQLGASIGSLLGPAGTVVGGIFGGIAGAIGGRMASNQIKRQALDQAIKEMTKAEIAFNQKARQEERRVTEAFASEKLREQVALRPHSDQAISTILKSSEALRNWRLRQQRIPREQALSILEAAKLELKALVEKIEAALKAKSWWCRWIWPDIQVLAQNEAIALLKTRKAEVNDLEAMALLAKDFDRAKVFTILGYAGVAQRQVEQIISNTEADRFSRESEFRDTIIQTRERIAELRLAAIKKLEKVMKTLRDELRQCLTPSLHKLKDCMRTVKHEAGKLGLSQSP